jgi:hypothetical protein
MARMGRGPVKVLVTGILMQAFVQTEPVPPGVMGVGVILLLKAHLDETS